VLSGPTDGDTLPARLVYAHLPYDRELTANISFSVTCQRQPWRCQSSLYGAAEANERLAAALYANVVEHNRALTLASASTRSTASQHNFAQPARGRHCPYCP
jgi:hypothetical protein